MSTYIKVTRNDMPGSYVQKIEEIGNALDGELDGATPGTAITFTLVEMTDEEYENTPEFEGW